MENRVLTLDEVLALPDGAEVWVETRWFKKGEGLHFRGKKDGDHDVLRRVDNPDNGCWLERKCVGETLRVWLREPTDAEREAAKWEVEA